MKERGKCSPFLGFAPKREGKDGKGNKEKRGWHAMHVHPCVQGFGEKAIFQKWRKLKKLDVWVRMMVSHK